MIPGWSFEQRAHPQWHVHAAAAAAAAVAAAAAPAAAAAVEAAATAVTYLPNSLRIYVLEEEQRTLYDPWPKL